jgi:hypothetical protein
MFTDFVKVGTIFAICITWQKRLVIKNLNFGEQQ